MGKKKTAPKPAQDSTKSSAADDDGVPATPHITAPGGGFVNPGVALVVSVMTNRGDLPYIVKFTDLTPPAAPPITTPIPAPGPGGTFNMTIPGGRLRANHNYEIHVRVDPAVEPSPPHQTDTVNVHTFRPPGPMHQMAAADAE